MGSSEAGVVPPFVGTHRRLHRPRCRLGGTKQHTTDDAAKATPTALASSSARTLRDTDELGNKLNTFEQITNYNNYYEFTADKEAVAAMAANFKSSPWTVEVTGLVNKPKTYDIDELRTKFD